jgi:hypothetical protein
MAETKKYFLDFGGLQTLWGKMKDTFATKNSVEALSSRLGTAETNITNLGKDIESVEAITLSYAPKAVEKYSDALAVVNAVAAGQIFVVGNNETIDGVLYKEGFYIVDSDKTLHYVGTTVGGSDSEIAALRDRIVTLEGQIIKSATIQTADGTQLSGITIANNSLIMIYDDEVVADTDSVHALTHRAAAAKFAELEGMISSVPKFKIEVVDTLPTMGWSLSTIYLVKNTVEQSNNLYTEYLYVENKGWEKLGEQTISIDNYVTKDLLNSTVNSAIADFVKSGEVAEMINNAKSEILTAVSNTYATKSEVAGMMTESDIITSIQEGNIGNAITITNDQINALA